MSQAVRQHIQKLQLIHGAQFAMITAFNILAYYFRPTGKVSPDSDDWLYVLAVFMAVTTTASVMMFRILVKKAQEQTNLNDKLSKYVAASLVRLALIESPGLLAAVMILITGNLQAYVGTVLTLMLFIVNRPRVTMMAEELILTAEEKSIVERG
jgi:hypothetical protein